jgi:hypothetical protein
MTDPSVRAYAYNLNNTVTNTNAIVWPAGIIAGDRLFLLAAGPYHPTALAGWDILYDVVDTNFQAGTLFTKIAAGTESGTTTTVTFSSSDRSCVEVVVVQDPAGYPVVSVANASSGVAPRVAVPTAGHTGSLMVYMGALRDGGNTPTLERGTTLVAAYDGNREAALIGSEVLTSNEETFQYYWAGIAGNGYFCVSIEMQVPAYTRGMNAAYLAAQAVDTPWLNWPLAADAQDVSGNARHGTVTGRWNFGRGMGIGDGGDGSQSLGGTSYIRSASLAIPAGKIAVEVIADITQTADNIRMVFCLGTSNFDLYLNGGGIIVNNGGSNVGTVQRQEGIHHVVIETTPGTDWTTSGSKIYIDGVLKATSGTHTIAVLGTTTVQVSGWPSSGGQELPAGYFVGGFAIYAGGLSAARVLAHWNALGTTTTGTGKPTDTASLMTMVAMEKVPGATVNGARPSLLRDLSGKRRHMLSSSANTGQIKLPATPAGKPSLMLGNLYAAAYNFQRGLMGDMVAGEMFVLFKHTADPPTLGDGRFWQIGNDGQISHIPYVDGQLYDNFGTTSRKVATNPTLSFAAQYTVYNVRSAAGAWSNYVENVLNYTTASNTVGWSNTPFIGWPDGNEQNTELVAFLMYGEVLASPDRAIALAWLDQQRSPVQIDNAFTGATVVPLDPGTLPASNQVDSTAYTTEGSEPLTMPLDKTGWAHFLILASGTYTFDTSGSNFDSGLAVYTGASVGALTLVASDHGSGTGSPLGSKLSVALTAGTTYHVQIGSGTGSASGTIMKLGVSVVSLTGALAPVSTAPGAQTSLGWLYKGRSNQASDALSGG